LVKKFNKLLEELKKQT